MDKKLNWQKFLAVLNKNGITKLYHFTDVRNLRSIIKYGGLYSWADCEEKRIVIPKPGGTALSRSLDTRDGLGHYVRLSFVKDHPMMHVAMDEDRISDPVILEINIEVALWENTKYADRNTTINGANVGGRIWNLNAVQFGLFQENYFDLDDDEKVMYKAEVLVKNHIPLSFITNIDDYLSVSSIPHKRTQDKETYGWKEIDREKFLTPNDIETIKKGVVEYKNLKSKLDGKFHNVTVLCFYMKSGGFKPFQLSPATTLQIGDEVNLDYVEIITFEDSYGDEHYRLDAKKIPSLSTNIQTHVSTFGWVEISREKFLTSKDIDSISRGFVVTKTKEQKCYDHSEYHVLRYIKFEFSSGGYKKLQLSNRSDLEDGDVVDLDSVELITFEDRDCDYQYLLDAQKVPSLVVKRDIILPDGWKETNRVKFLSKKDIETIKKGVVERRSLESNTDGVFYEVYCLCFYTKSGEFKPYQLSHMSFLEPGNKVNLDSVELITFEDRYGEEHYRLDAKKNR